MLEENDMMRRFKKGDIVFVDPPNHPSTPGYVEQRAGVTGEIVMSVNRGTYLSVQLDDDEVSTLFARGELFNVSEVILR